MSLSRHSAKNTQRIILSSASCKSFHLILIIFRLVPSRRTSMSYQSSCLALMYVQVVQLCTSVCPTHAHHLAKSCSHVLPVVQWATLIRAGGQRHFYSRYSLHRNEMKKITRFSGRNTISYAALSMHFPPSLWCDYRHYIDNIKLRFVLNCLKYPKTLCSSQALL